MLYVRYMLTNHHIISQPIQCQTKCLGKYCALTVCCVFRSPVNRGKKIKSIDLKTINAPSEGDCYNRTMTKTSFPIGFRLNLSNTKASNLTVTKAVTCIQESRGSCNLFIFCFFFRDTWLYSVNCARVRSWCGFLGRTSGSVLLLHCKMRKAICVKDRSTIVTVFCCRLLLIVCIVL